MDLLIAVAEVAAAIWLAIGLVCAIDGAATENLFEFGFLSKLGIFVCVVLFWPLPGSREEDTSLVARSLRKSARP